MTAWVALALVLLTGGAADQAPAAPLGAISGTVQSWSNHEPIARAIVTLSGGRPFVIVSTISAVDGRFEFSGLPEGRFILNASKPAFLRSEFGAARPEMAGTPIALAAGARLSDVRLPLAKGAVVAGTLRDESGASLPNVHVRLFRIRRLGQNAAAQGAGETLTNDQGQFRLFGLPPGQYLLQVDAPAAGSGPLPRMTAARVDRLLAALRRGERVTFGVQEPAAAAGDTESYTYAPVFYPGTTMASDAEVLTLSIGQELAGLDMRVEAVPSATVSGRAIGAPPGWQVRVTLTPAGTVSGLPGHSARSESTRPDGSFEMSAVAPGAYHVDAKASGPAAATGPAGAPPAMMWASAPVNVDAGSTTSVSLDLRPAIALVGRVVFAGAGPPPTLDAAHALRIELTPAAAAPSAAGSAGAAVKSDGTFAVLNLTPGAYRVSASWGRRPADWWLESATVDGQDVLDSGLVVTDDASSGALLTFSDRHTEIAGRLTTEDDRPATAFQVVVLPCESSYWRQGSRRIRTLRPDTDGRFSTVDLPAGEYCLAVVTDDEAPDLGSSEFLDALVRGAVRVTLQDGARVSQDLRLAR